ncbi:MAG: hypothetical protein MUF21_06405 [Gemmatimonadaceae bacterium]|jgi:hypothetical protein|nr:hypothetical protein [Gemmatimonadaceae bacterium]
MPTPSTRTRRTRARRHDAEPWHVERGTPSVPRLLGALVFVIVLALVFGRGYRLACRGDRCVYVPLHVTGDGDAVRMRVYDIRDAGRQREALVTDRGVIRLPDGAAINRARLRAAVQSDTLPFTDEMRPLHNPVLWIVVVIPALVVLYGTARPFLLPRNPADDPGTVALDRAIRTGAERVVVLIGLVMMVTFGGMAIWIFGLAMRAAQSWQDVAAGVLLASMFGTIAVICAPPFIGRRLHPYWARWRARWRMPMSARHPTSRRRRSSVGRSDRGPPASAPGP